MIHIPSCSIANRPEGWSASFTIGDVKINVGPSSSEQEAIDVLNAILCRSGLGRYRRQWVGVR